MKARERVAVARCPASTPDAEIVRRTEALIGMLGGDLSPIRGARKIAVKINAGIDRVILTDGRQTELTEPAVVEGVIRALRSVTDAEIVVGDAPTDGDGELIYGKLGYAQRLAAYANVRLLDFGYGDLVEVETPGEKALFRRYRLHRELADSDAFVSIAKMKAHMSLGCTLCIKNLFGWTPPRVYGQPRMYLHDRLVRLPRVQADLAELFRPALNVVDGIVAANMSEWHGQALQPEALVAGTNIVATDHVAARIMGFDPQTDYPNHPYFYRRNCILLAAERGIGPNSPDRIDVLGPAPEEVAMPFTVRRYEEESHRASQLREGFDCAMAYWSRQDEYADRYRGRYLALQGGEVVWEGGAVHDLMRQEKESRLTWSEVPPFWIHCVSAAEEAERYEQYAEDVELAVGC